LRRHLLVTVSALLTVIGPEVQAQATAEAPTVPVGDALAESFDAALTPYGTWVSVSGMGRVWRPTPAFVGSDFRPYYSGGHWVYTDAGWTFETNYTWGWAPFHYGRWWYDHVYGWVWLPGTRWAPAWVDWRYGEGRVGWAPMPPSGYHFAPAAEWGTPWCFIGTRHITRAAYAAYAVPAAEVHAVLATTQAAPLIGEDAEERYSAGPPASHFEAAGVPVQPVAVAMVAHAIPPPTARAPAPVVSTTPSVAVPHPTETVSRELQEKAISAARAGEPAETPKAETPDEAAQEPPVRSATAAHKMTARHKAQVAHPIATHTPRKVAHAPRQPARVTASQPKAHAHTPVHRK
jgi:hypothetical protein